MEILYAEDGTALQEEDTSDLYLEGTLPIPDGDTFTGSETESVALMVAADTFTVAETHVSTAALAHTDSFAWSELHWIKYRKNFTAMAGHTPAPRRRPSPWG